MEHLSPTSWLIKANGAFILHLVRISSKEEEEREERVGQCPRNNPFEVVESAFTPDSEH